jgi:hypothetical protein
LSFGRLHKLIAFILKESRTVAQGYSITLTSLLHSRILAPIGALCNFGTNQCYASTYLLSEHEGLIVGFSSTSEVQTTALAASSRILSAALGNFL